ncbi:hypothetical protein M422DRAFT_251567 [Sphaerobolus stellatus SS14]|uniref:DUF6533 domain-containing protein n=1 Tax=Sphaerobolus stellatus (strain SS14) TaxID=990650 RepID=A0A0C9W1X5_SPHS4|nr:hypothetical protein M422DRAFT_251567 [Sphaerobolus stellatus SS14]
MGPSLALEFAFVCCSIAAFALLIWDHVITFGEEVSKIWMKKISGGSVLYLLLRYGTAVEKITIMLLASWYMNPHGQVLLSLRIAGLVADLLSETIVITVTLRKTFALRKNLNDRSSLSLLLLRDGTLYFGALLILSLADMLVLIFDHVPANVVGYNYWVVPYYTPVFRTIIICRFLLMLRTIYFFEDNDEKSHVASMKFASRVVGNLGTTLDFAGEGEAEDDIIYTRDPFTTGLTISEASGSTVEGNEVKITDDELDSASSYELQSQNEEV